MKKLFVTNVCLLLVLFNSAGWGSENSTTTPAEKLRFYVDQAAFKGDDDGVNGYLEIYISIPAYQFKYQPKGKSFLAAYEISISLFDANEKLAAEKKWQGFNQIDSLNQAEGLTTLDIAAFMVHPATYQAKIHITDLNSQACGDAAIPVTIKAFSGDSLALSDVQFARSIKKTTERNKFVKNKIDVIPNPSRAFGIESPFVYFYGEIYNIPQMNNKSTKLTRAYYLVDNRGDTVKSDIKQISPRGSSSVWVGKINILDLISGSYDLHLIVTDAASKMSARQQADFWINNPYKMLTFKQYRKEDIEEFKAQIYYIVDENERSFFDQLATPAKINYINNFWKNIDPKFRSEHLKRFYIAKERFSSPTLKGWKTDRGRVYIMYGPPDDVDRHPASLSTRAYEIWYYEHMRGQSLVQFVFVDLGIQGNYQLVHSDLQNGERQEIYNPNWRGEIRISR
ncbi:MAG: GWxTD domain-containing protein [Calditrichaeota bacterium]|nr:GWxTD domain-containing protein [Calditrichota bacterium]